MGTPKTSFIDLIFMEHKKHEIPAGESRNSPVNSLFSVFDLVKFPVCVIDLQGQLISRNKEFSRLFDQEEGHLSLDLTHPFFPEYRRRIAVSYLRALKGQERQCFAVMKDSDGNSIPVEIYLFPIFQRERVDAILVFLKIVNERIQSFDRAADIVMEDDVTGVSRIYEFSPNPMMRFNRQGQILKVSDSLKGFLGYTVEELLKNRRYLYKSVSHYDFSRIRKAILEILENKISFKRIGDVRVKARNEEEKWMNVIIYPLGGDKKVDVIEMIFEDITKIRRLENRASANSRIQIIGDITKGLLHSFNNLISIIMSRSQMLLQVTEKDFIVDGLKSIERTAIEGVKQIRRIEDFMGEGYRIDEFYEESLIDIVEDAIEFAKIQFKVESKEKRRMIRIDKRYFSKVVINTNMRLLRELLLSVIFRVSNNISKSGNLSIVLKENGSPVITITSTTDREGGDEGEYIANPFYQELDLRRIAEKINVKIIEEESPDTYAIQVIMPPGMVVEKKTHDMEKVNFRLRDLRILIVEDDKDLKNILYEIFSSMGNRVTLFENGLDALTEVKNNRFDLLITDYGIEGITGLELAARAKEQDERLITVLLTGWMLDDLKTYKNVIDLYFPKPFKLDVLIKEIAKSLSAKKD